jgi:hypothetical protein
MIATQDQGGLTERLQNMRSNMVFYRVSLPPQTQFMEVMASSICVLREIGFRSKFSLAGRFAVCAWDGMRRRNSFSLSESLSKAIATRMAPLACGKADGSEAAEQPVSRCGVSRERAGHSARALSRFSSDPWLRCERGVQETGTIFQQARAGCE